MTGLASRLRERKVVQWGLTYAASAFALIQAADIIGQRFGWPEQAMRLLILFAAIGFVVALVVAWYHGERGAQRVSVTEILILSVVLAVGGLATWRWGTPSSHPTVESDVQPDAQTQDSSVADSSTSFGNVPEGSIAVLPLSNESGNPDDDYFSDGLSEDLITALSQFAGLKVISRNSSFLFRRSSEDSRTIGRKLGVANLLEGSVRRAGDAVRISATLVRAVDGSTAWAQHYDRPYKDLFRLQDDITGAVASALKAKLLTEPGAVVQSDRPPGGSLDAFNAFMKGRQYLLGQTQEDTGRAIELFEEASRLDPTYARAYAGQAVAWTLQGGTFFEGSETRAAYAKAHAALDKALSLNPSLAYAYYAQGRLLLWDDFDWAGSAAAYRRAAELAPGSSESMEGLAASEATAGNLEKAVEFMRRAIKVDALLPSHHFWLSAYLAGLDRLDEAKEQIRTVIQQQPTTAYAYAQLAQIEVQRGDAKAALDAAMQTPAGIWRDIAFALVRQIGSDRAAADAALKQLIDSDGDSASMQIAETYAIRKDPDRMFEWLDRALVERDPAIGTLLWDPLLRPYQHDPRFAAFAARAGLTRPVGADATSKETLQGPGYVAPAQ